MIIENKEDVIKYRKTQLYNDKEPIPINALQSITINPTELCNRTCHFCPRHDPKVYPNQSLHMSKETAEILSNELKKINYTNRIGWSGNGEPLLTENILELIEIVSKKNPQIKHHEINTNGDKLLRKIGNINVHDLYKAGITHILVSVYDGEEKFNEFENFFKENNISKEKYSLRKSYYHNANFKNFSNRAGMINFNDEQVKEYFNNKCYLPFYKLIIDWNGDQILCCEDWHKLSTKILKMNIRDGLQNLWESSYINNYRKKLIQGDRKNLAICKNCNVHGEKIGKEYTKYYEL